MGYLRARNITSGSSAFSLFGARSVPGNASGHSFPQSGTFNQGSITVPTAPGVGNSHTLSIKNDSGVDQGTNLVLSGTSQSVRTTISVPIPIYDLGTPTNSLRYGSRLDSGSPPANQTKIIYDYFLDGVDRGRSLIGLGEASQSFTTTTTNKYQQFDGKATDINGTESIHQAPWPTNGFFGPFLFSWTLTPTTGTTEIALRKNGVDALVISLPGQATTLKQVTFSSSSVSVTAGDLVNLRIKRTGSTDGNLAFILVMAFSNFQ